MLIRKNKTYEGYTPRLIVTSEFIEREKFKLLSQEEILKHFEEIYPDDMFGFSLEVLDDYLPTEYMKEKFIDAENIVEFEEYRANLKELTIEDTVQDMLDYLVFGWTKIEDQRGLSAGRNVMKLKVWFHILSRPDLVNIISQEYTNYGRDNMLEIFEKLSLYNPSKTENGPDLFADKLQELVDKEGDHNIELGGFVVEEFVNKFQERFPEISTKIDFEKNRNGNILIGKIIGGNYTIHNINFYKKPEIDKKDFEESLNIFITNHTLEDKSKFVMETLGGMVFEIGDGDDTLAVTYKDVLDEYVACIWFRWFGDVKKAEND